MNRWRSLAVVLGVLAIGTVAQASIVVTFDDLSTSPGTDVSDWGYVPTNYQGLSWTGWEVTKADNTVGSYQKVYNNSYGANTLKNIAYNGGSGNFVVTTTDTQPFYFEGALVSTFAMNNNYTSWSAQTMTIKGWLGATLVGTITVSLPKNQLISTALSGSIAGAIDKLEVLSDGNGNDGKYWVMDDFTYRPVPEPASLILWGLGGLGMAVGACRRRWKK